jgi:hypothetical protein
MRYYHFLILFLLVVSPLLSQECILKIEKESMMHEVRATSSPSCGEHVLLNPPRFMWPDKYPHLGAVLDGVECTEVKPEVTYWIRISKDATFKSNVITGERNWAFFNPFEPLEEGKWYWQYAFVDEDGAEEWSPVLHFYVDKNSLVFNPPSFETILQKLPSYHPRILFDKEEWDNIIERNKNNPETQSYFETADKCLKNPLKSLDKEVDTTQLTNLSNEVQYKSVLIRESRKIVDREERNIESLIRAYLLTKDNIYYAERVKRLL